MGIKLKELRLYLPMLPLPELNILHLSDFHLAGDDPKIKNALKKEAYERDYDFIFLTGDLIDDDKGIAPLIDYLSLLNSRYGSFCVWGNHDKFNLRMRHIFTFNHNTEPSQMSVRNLEKLRKGLSDLNIRVLVDELERVEIKGFVVSIIGLDDWFGVDRLQNWEKHEIRIQKLKQMISKIPEDNFKILLTHVPDVIEIFSECGINLVFSGHTHGGQICLPFIGPLFTWSGFQRKYYKGLYKYNGSYIHISPGLGTSRCTPLRFMCPPEISVIKVKGKA